MWSEKSYNAIFDWLVLAKRDKVREILKADGLKDVVKQLDNALTLRVWYRVIHEAAKSVGPEVVARQSARLSENIQEELKCIFKEDKQ